MQTSQKVVLTFGHFPITLTFFGTWVVGCILEQMFFVLGI